MPALLHFRKRPPSSPYDAVPLGVRLRFGPRIIPPPTAAMLQASRGMGLQQLPPRPPKVLPPCRVSQGLSMEEKQPPMPALEDSPPPDAGAKELSIAVREMMLQTWKNDHKNEMSDLCHLLLDDLAGNNHKHEHKRN